MNWLTNIIGFGRVTRVDDSGDLLRLQVTEGARGGEVGDRVLDMVPRVAEYGLHSVPPLGAELVMIRRFAERCKSVVIGTSHRPSRPKNLNAGDVVIYNAKGIRITLTDQALTIDAATLPVVIQRATDVTIKASGKLRVEANTLEVTGDVVARADGTRVSLGGLRDAYNVHKHGGVQTGSGSSGAPDRTA